MFRYLRWRLTQGTGWLEEKEDPRDYGPNLLEGWKKTRRVFKSLEKILDVPVILNQRALPSCVVNATAYGLMIESGVKIVPSRHFMFYNSRKKHQKKVHLTGTYVRTCVKQLMKMGVPREKVWPYKTTTVNRQPPVPAYMKAYKAKDGVYCKIKSYGGNRVQDILTAITMERPVVFGAKIAREFYGYRKGILHKPKTKIKGGHALTIVGYSKCHDGYKFRVVNSWGTGWGEGGYCWMHEDYIKSKYCKDFWIFKHGGYGR
jgi:hypothetical protein